MPTECSDLAEASCPATARHHHHHHPLRRSPRRPRPRVGRELEERADEDSGETGGIERERLCSPCPCPACPTPPHRTRQRLKRASSASYPSPAPSSVLFLLLLFLLSLCRLSGALRCYTDVKATKGESVECGLNTGCVKIYIDSDEKLMQMQREIGFPPGSIKGSMPELPEKYQGNPVIMRGCFVLAVPDRCYNAKDGLSYCWCSQKDLCNRAAPRAADGARAATVAAAAVAAIAAARAWR